MSCDTSWVASADIGLAELEQRMKLRRTGQACPCPFADGYAAFRLKDGWSLVVASRVDYVESLDRAMVAHSGNLVTLALHEGIMSSVAESWTNRHPVETV